jgi:hypothetical protein
MSCLCTSNKRKNDDWIVSYEAIDTSVSDMNTGTDCIRFQSGQWIWIRIKDGKNDHQK